MGKNKRKLDWDAELAIRIGLVSEATPETQEKLDVMHEAYIANNRFMQGASMGTTPPMILESESKRILERERTSFERDVKELRYLVEQLERENLNLRIELRDLKESL